jgi:predicted nucleotidyltransferase
MLVDTPTQPLSFEAIEAVATRLKALCARYPVRLCYLYGSQVRGTAHALSDVDVGFLLDDMDQKAYRELWIDLYEAVSQLCPDHEVDLVILNLAGPLLRNKVIREGRLIFKKDEHIRVDFECRTLESYFDFRYFADIYDHALFQCIKGGGWFGRSRDRRHALESVTGVRAAPGGDCRTGPRDLSQGTVLDCLG